MDNKARIQGLRPRMGSSGEQLSPSPGPGLRFSPYAEILEDGFWALGFPHDIEVEFRRARSPVVRRRLATVDMLGALGIGAWLVLDAFTRREFQFPGAWVALGGWIAVLLGHFALLRFIPRRFYPVPLVSVTAVIDFAGCAVLVGLGLLMQHRGLPGAYFLYLALLTLIFAQFLLSMMMWKALGVGVMTIIAYGVGHALVASPPGYSEFIPLAQALFFLVTTVLIGAAVGWQREYAAREQFLLSRLVEEAAEHDSLTGLLNHGSFVSHCEHIWQQATREGKRLGLAIGDIDHFKRYNDLYGHPAGDECLQRVAHVFLHAAGRGLDEAGRLGGEEFAIVWYDIEEETLRYLTDRLHAAVEALDIPMAQPSPSTHVTISVGALSIVPVQGLSLKSALGAADRALYKAKNAGRNRVESAAYGKSG